MKSKKLTNQLLINKVIYLRVLHSFEVMIFNAFLGVAVAVTFSNTRKGKTDILKYVLLSVTLGIFMHFKNILNKS